MQIIDPMDVNKNALLSLREKHSHINIVDVGCARGALVTYANKLSFESIMSIGIDPIDHRNERPNYNSYIQCAIDNVDPDKIITASFYINQDDQASSLLKMDFENITNDLSHKDSKYYIQWADKLRIIRDQKVLVKPLSAILDEQFPHGQIHLLKIDAEGKDLDVVKSAGHHISRVKYISLECSSHKNDSIRIFKGGCHINQIVPYMKSIGFAIYEKFDCEEDPNNLTQMCDIVFVRLDADTE